MAAKPADVQLFLMAARAKLRTDPVREEALQASLAQTILNIHKLPIHFLPLFGHLSGEGAKVIGIDASRQQDRQKRGALVNNPPDAA